MAINPYLAAMCCEYQDVNPLFNHLGARLISAEKGQAVIVMPVSPCFTQGGGAIAGGIIATLADEGMAHAVISLLEPETTTVTTEMNIRYLRSADPNKEGQLISTATVIKAGRHIMTAEAQVRDGDGRLLATAGGSFYVVPNTGRDAAQPA